MADYFNKMKSHAEEMTASVQLLGDEEFVAYILTGLDEEIYNSLVSSIVTRLEPISPSELYTQMLSFELRLNKQFDGSYSSANAATHDYGTSWSRGGSIQNDHGRGRGCTGGRGPSLGGRDSYSNNQCHAPGSSFDVGQSRPRCQVCMKIGHIASTCWY
jgi:hypothetical protein